MSENGWGLLLRAPAEGETPPTLVEPPKLFRPMKALFDGLGIAPAYTEADVSVPFMCYFSLFFAMLVGDGAYGAIFLAGTLAMAKKLPKSWFVLLTFFSSATVTDGADGVHDALHRVFLGLEGQVFAEARPRGDDQRITLVRDSLPDLLGDEGHERCDQVPPGAGGCAFPALRRGDAAAAG